MSRRRQIAEFTARMAAAAALLASPGVLAAAAAPARLDYEAVATSDAGVPDADPQNGAGQPAAGVAPAPTAGPGMEAPAEQPADTSASDQSADGGGQDAPDIHDDGGKRRHRIAPYIEAQQVADTELSPQSGTFTYSELAAGIDGSLDGRNTQAAVSLRYERQIGEGNGAGSGNIVSGVARASVGVVPGLLQLDAAGFATRTNVFSDGAAVPGIAVNDNSLTQIYSVVGGPTLSAHAGDVKIDGAYHIGYTHVGTSGELEPTTTGSGDSTGNAGVASGDIFDHSTEQNANLRASTRPGDGLPVGVALEGGYYREDISDLAQRATDAHVRGEVTIPVASDLAVIGGLGYEAVKVSSLNAVLDAQGNPVYDGNGRLEADYAGPRYIAFDTSGLIWDVGVLWRPSRRTSLEAHVSRRYGEIGAYGLFTWHSSTRAALNVAVYNNMADFGGQLDSALLDLSTQFQAVRNGLTGNITPCVNSMQSGNCLTGQLGTLNGAVFRARGVSASYNLDFGRIQAGIGAGYDRREYIAAAGTVLGVENGEVDQYYWVTGFVTYAIDRHSSLAGTLDAYWFRTGLVLDGDLNAVGATAVYQRSLARNVTASAALGIDSINRQALEDVWAGTGSLAVRYTF